MQVYLLQISPMGGLTPLRGVAYLYKEVAELVAEERKEEWTTYTYRPVSAEGEIITDDRCIIDGRVYQINKVTPKEKHRQRGLAKLTPAEKEALEIQ